MNNAYGLMLTTCWSTGHIHPKQEKSSYLITVREAIKKKLEWGTRPGQTDRNLFQSQECQTLLAEWAARAKNLIPKQSSHNVTSAQKKDAYSPIEIWHEEEQEDRT